MNTLFKLLLHQFKFAPNILQCMTNILKSGLYLSKFSLKCLTLVFMNIDVLIHDVLLSLTTIPNLKFWKRDGYY